MPTIELGEVTAGSRSEPAEPGRTASRPTSRRRAARPVWLGLVLVVLLGTVAAGNPFPRPWPETIVPARLGSMVFADRDWLFVTEPGRPDGGGAELVAYRLPAAEPRWRVPLPSGDAGNLRLLGDHLVVATHPEPTLDRPARLTVLDVSAGALAWEREASLMAVTGVGDLVLWTETGDGRPDPDNPGGPEFGEQRPGTLEAVDAATGAPRWSVPVPAGALPSFDTPGLDPNGAARVTTLVLALPSGRVEVRDLGSGAVVRARQLAEPGDGPRTRVRGEALGGLFLVYGEGTVTAYGLPRLDRRWSVPNDLAVERGPFVCGADLCSLRPQRGLRVWDARTGGTRWADDRWSGLWPVGDALVAVAASTGYTEAMAVLDPATGRVRADLGAWSLFVARGERLVGVRYGVDRRAWVMEFDPATWHRRLLAVLPGVSGDCGLTATVLHCRRPDASIGVWRLPG